jgi:hypothetical protein
LPELSSFGGELTVDDELREQLGLEAGESLRILDSGGTTLILERKTDSPVAIPWDRDLVLTAEVRAFPLADILDVIHGAGKSGFLYFRRGDHEKSVYLHRGEVVFATSNQTVDRLGESLLRSGLLTLDQLRDAERYHQPPQRFGKVLVQRGILTSRALWEGVKTQIEDIVRSLFSYTAGTVHLWEGEVQPDNVVRLSLPTRRLVAEGLRRRDELLRLLALVEDPRVRIIRHEANPDALAANERAFLEALDVADEFQSVCRCVGLDPLSGARTLQLLSLIGAVKIERSESPGSGRRSELARHPDDSVRACVLQHLALLGELAAPIVAVEGGRQVAQRMKGLMDDAAERHPRLFRDLEVSPSGTLDPDPLIARALRLPGDRVRTVAAALGELVSYLEFELRNHPRIQEPEHFLEAVSELRARLEV